MTMADLLFSVSNTNRDTKDELENTNREIKNFKVEYED
jgi:hypothetical protein